MSNLLSLLALLPIGVALYNMWLMSLLRDMRKADLGHGMTLDLIGRKHKCPRHEGEIDDNYSPRLVEHIRHRGI